MDPTRFVLPFLVYCVTAISSETVQFFDLCGILQVDRLISNTEKLTVSMDGYRWQSSSISCSVVFKSLDRYNNLNIKFDSFFVSDIGINVEIQSKYVSFYSVEDNYGYINSPTIGYQKSLKPYVKITVTRRSTDEEGVTAQFDIFTDVYKNNDFGSDVERVGTIVGVIVGGVIGSIVFIVIVVVIIVCCVCNSKSRRQRGVVMATGNPQVTSTTVMPVYPYQAPPENYAMHPSAQPVGYPVQPGAYPMMTYPSAPPPYTTVPNGNTNPDVQKVTPTAPN